MASKREALQRYRFGLETADFLLCRDCGVYIGASIETPDGGFGIINVRALTDSISLPSSVEPASYDSEDVAARIARRKVRWTPLASAPG